jgi:hypothetical protein
VKSRILIAAAVILSGTALAALAADPPKDAPKQLTPQQQRMSDCSKASKGMKADEHKKFMSDCLKKDSTVDLSGASAKPADGKTAQQEKMTTCNKDAADKKLAGAARQKFMSECLSGGAKEPKVEPKPAGGKPPQQDKMKTCNAMADKDKLKGDARSKFVTECLKNQA